MKQRKDLGLRHLALALVLVALAGGLASLRLTPALANGTNYYVDSVNGSDSNSGTSSAAPWKTLANINSRSFNPGDTISLKDGSTWSGTGANSAALTVHGAGSAGNPIVIQSYGSGNAPILTNPTAVPTSGSNSANGMNIVADYVTVNGIEFDNNAEACVDVFGTYVTIENSQMTACGAGVEDRANYTTITHNNFHDLIAATNDNEGDYWGGDGMMIEGSSNDEIDYNTCTNCISTGFTPATGDGGFVEFYDSNSNVTIDHNYVNNTWQVSQLGSSGGTDSNIEWAYNVFINVGPVIGLHLGGTWETYYSNLVLINNTCYWTTSANGPNIIYTDSGDSDGFTSGDLTERNNLFVTTASGMGTDQNTEAFTHDHNIYEGFSYEDYSMGTGEHWNENPDFVNAAADNFELQAGSPAIGAGLAPAPFSTDYAGDPVPSANGVDIGAYEYGTQAGPTATPTVAPTSGPGPTSTPEPTATPTSAPASGNLMQNGSFESGTSPWSLQVNSPASASLSQDTTVHASDGGVASAKVSIAADDTSSPYNIQLRQAGLSTCSACSYQLSFWAMAAASRSLEAVVQGLSSPYTVYFDRSPTVGTSWQEYTYTVTPGASDAVFVGFNLGASTSTIWIDGVSLTNLSTPTATPAPTSMPTTAPTATPAPSNLLQNGTFDTSVSPWTLQINSPAAGTLAWDGTTGDPAAGSAKVNITTADSNDPYDAQFRQTGLSLAAGQRYQVTFWAKASQARTIGAVVQMQNSPYTLYADQAFSVSTSWQQFAFSVSSSQSATAFLGFNLAGSSGTVWIDTVSLALASSSSPAQGQMSLFLPAVMSAGNEDALRR